MTLRSMSIKTSPPRTHPSQLLEYLQLDASLSSSLLSQVLICHRAHRRRHGQCTTSPQFWSLHGPHLLGSCLAAQSCPTLCDPLDCNPPCSPVLVFQARTLELVIISSYRESLLPRDQTHVSCYSCIGRQILYRVSHQGSINHKDKLLLMWDHINKLILKILLIKTGKSLLIKQALLHDMLLSNDCH